jgi:hypothetical protein
MLTPPDFAYRVSGGDTAHFRRHGFNYDGERKEIEVVSRE